MAEPSLEAMAAKADEESGPGLFGGLQAALNERDHADTKFSFEDKNILITGASSGIGYATARKLIRSGANVCMLGRNVEKMQELADSAKRGKGFYKEIDLTEEENVPGVFDEAMDEFGGVLDVLINVAGI